MHTIPLPGMHFFDAWRIRPSLQPDNWERNFPRSAKRNSSHKNPQTQTMDKLIEHRREQEREARGAAKTTAQLALEMSHVRRLAALVTEKAELLKELAMLRKSYQDEVKEGSKGKTATSSAAPKKQKTTDVYLPPQPHHSPLLRPPLMAVRLWRLMHKAARPRTQELRSLIRSHLLNLVEPRPLPHGLRPHLCQPHRLAKTIKTLPHHSTHFLR